MPINSDGNVVSGSGLSVDVSLSRKSSTGISGHGKLLSLVYRSMGPFEDTHLFTFEEILAINSAGQVIDLVATGIEVTYNTTVVWPGDTNNDGIVVFEIWHIDHSGFTAKGLELYVLTEYEE